jgi:hypothetical protein
MEQWMYESWTGKPGMLWPGGWPAAAEADETAVEGETAADKADAGGETALEPSEAAPGGAADQVEASTANFENSTTRMLIFLVFFPFWPLCIFFLCCSWIFNPSYEVMTSSSFFLTVLVY